MEIEVKNLAKSEIEITISVPENKMKEFSKKACEELSRDVKVKGFRPGKVPPHILDQYVDKNYIKAYAQELAIRYAYVEAVKEKDLPVVSRPKVKVETEEPFKFSAIVAVLPEVEIKDYKSIKIKKEESKITDKDIDEVIDDIKKYRTNWADVDRAAKKGDRAEVDFEGYDKDGKVVENTKSSNHPVVLGEGSLIPGFEEEIIGLKKDEKKEFDITFPKDYSAKELQGTKLTFKVEVKRIEEPSEPEFTKEFIKEMTGKEMTVEDFRKDIEKNIKARKKKETSQKRENEYIEAILKKAKLEIPESLVDEEVEHIFQDMKGDIESKGMEFEKFLEQAKATTEDMKAKYRPEGERRIKIRLVLQKLIELEEIKIDDQEAKAEFEKVKSHYPKEQHKKIEKDFKKGELRLQIFNRLSLRKLFDKVLG
jgi:trigger factor